MENGGLATLHAQLGAVNRARAGNVRQLRSGGLLQYVQ